MKKFLILLFLLLLLQGCSKKNGIVIGYSLPGIPIVLEVSKNGVNISFNNRVFTPIGSFAISMSLKNIIKDFDRHATYIEIYNKKDNNKIVFKLTDIGESLEINTEYKTQIKVINYKYYSRVIINSEEISNFIHIEPEVDPKPKFPESPIQYFVLCKSVHVDWSIRNFWDLIQNIIYAIFFIIIFILDLLIIIILFFLRIIWFLLMITWYFLSNML